MTLGWKLFLVFLAFLTLLTTVIVVAFRERKRGRTLEVSDVAGQQAQDGRVLVVIFSSIVGGMALTVLTAWLVFF